jgi:hypothetical protein
MKIYKSIAAIIFCIGLLFSISSCAVHVRHDHGNHRGWYKNSNNPHHYNSTNPGKHKENSKK